MQYITLPRILIAGSLAALVGLPGVFFGVTTEQSNTEMRLETSAKVVRVGDTFTTKIIVSSQQATNVYAGQVRFDPAKLVVDSINYNTSIADLWVEEPWYVDGDGTITFAGGTTRHNGFVGSDTLLTVTFRAIAHGTQTVWLSNERILLHDGFGTDAVLADTVAAVVSVESSIVEQTEQSRLVIVDSVTSADLNGDGEITIRDTSIFMQDLATQSKRSDFNGDGRVTLADYSIFSLLKK